jgi:hypothetical protein
MQLPVLPKKQLLYLSGGILSESEYNNRLGQNDIFAVFMVILLLINDQYLQIFAGISYPYLSPTKKQNLTEKHFMKFLIYQMI